jgi:hypothetical protein
VHATPEESLSKPIDSLNKAAEMMRTSWINKTLRLMHIDLLFQDYMEKSILNIQLMHRPSTCNNQEK